MADSSLQSYFVLLVELLSESIVRLFLNNHGLSGTAISWSTICSLAPLIYVVNHSYLRTVTTRSLLSDPRVFMR